MPWIERVRTEQPLDAGVGIDLSNKFGAAFVTGVFGNLGIGISATGKLTTVSAGAENDGRLISFNNTAGNKVDIGPVVLASTSGMSIAAMSKKTTGHAFTSPIFDNKGFADWTNSPGFAFVVRPDGGLLFYIATSETYSTTNLFNDAKFHTSSAIWKPGVSQDIYVDGVKPSYTSSAIAGSYTNTTTQLKLGTYYDLAGARSGAQKIAYALLFKVAFSPAEMQELHANPWQLFEKERIFVPLTTGGDTAAITQADGTSTAGTLGGAASAASTPTAADGTSTAASIAASAIAAAGVASADGTSTASTLAGSAVNAAAITQADGVSTTSVLGATATATTGGSQADGISAASVLEGVTIAATTPSTADGVSTAGTLVGVGSTAGSAGITAGEGTSTTSALTGGASATATVTTATGVSVAAEVVGAGTAFVALTAAGGTTVSGTLAGAGIAPTVASIAAGSSSVVALAAGAAASSNTAQADGFSSTSALAATATASSDVTLSAGVSSTSTLGASGNAPAEISTAVSTSATSTLGGVATHTATLTGAAGASTASAFAASAVAATIAIAAASVSSARALAGTPPNTAGASGVVHTIDAEDRTSAMSADVRTLTVLFGERRATVTT